jgi:hypothetical protein
MQRETPKPPNLNAFTATQGIAHEVQQVLNREFNVFRRQVFLFSGN